jgi:hypothetical protein
MLLYLIGIGTGEMKSRDPLDPLSYDRPSDEINGNTGFHTNEGHH